MTMLEHLHAARALIVLGWTQKCFARDANDRNVPWGGTSAVKWCMSGALQQVMVGRIGKDHGPAIKELMKDIGNEWVAAWNDAPERTQQEVLDAYDRTIARLTLASGSGKVGE